MDRIEGLMLFVAGILVGLFLASLIMGWLDYQCYDGGYIQAMKNCIQSHDFNSTYCTHHKPW